MQEQTYQLIVDELSSKRLSQSTNNSRIMRLLHFHLTVTIREKMRMSC